jgi:hypothetical protein
MFTNIETTLDAVSESDLHDKNIAGLTLGQQLYHLIMSLNQWFINPDLYYEHARHSMHLVSAAEITKTMLASYCTAIKGRIMAYLQGLDSAALGEPPEGGQYARLDLILGQLQHGNYRLGLIHSCLGVHSGGAGPDYISLESTFKPRE